MKGSDVENLEKKKKSKKDKKAAKEWPKLEVTVEGSVIICILVNGNHTIPLVVWGDFRIGLPHDPASCKKRLNIPGALGWRSVNCIFSFFFPFISSPYMSAWNE